VAKSAPSVASTAKKPASIATPSEAPVATTKAANVAQTATVDVTKAAPVAPPVKSATTTHECNAKKRRASSPAQPPLAPKTPKFTPCVNDWHCAVCGWWNYRWYSLCRGFNHEKNKPCDQTVGDPYFRNFVQPAGDGVNRRKSRAKFQGDWLCENRDCQRWNRMFWSTCRCGAERDDAMEFIEDDPSLPQVPPPPPRRQDTGGYVLSQEQEKAKYWKTNGRFTTSRKKKWGDTKKYGAKNLFETEY